MPYSDDAKNLMLDNLGTSAIYVSLHTADPGTTGVGEVTGGSYARQSVTWNVAVGGNLDSSNTPEFDVPGGTTVTHFAAWSALTAGVYYGGSALSAAETFSGDGTYTLTDIDMDLNA